MEKRTSKSLKNDQQVVVLEDVNSKFDLILEQYSTLRGDIRKNSDELAEFRKETDSNFKILFDFRNDMLEFKDGNEKNMAVALEYLSRIDDEIQDMKLEIKELKAEFGGSAESGKILDFEKRLKRVEKLLATKLA